MEWSKWSGFVGEGEYVIINKQSLTSLDLSNPSLKSDTEVRGHAHCPNNGAQLWRFRKGSKGDAYAIQSFHNDKLLTAVGKFPMGRIRGSDRELILAAGPEQAVTAITMPAQIPFELFSCPREALWAIDSSLYSMEPGKMVVLRSVMYPGYVLDLHNGETTNGTPVNLRREPGIDGKREMQKWLLQKQT
ncbi:MAG: hypothetical protein LQ338_004230 [Usnochroma carphineum]|nr:MAG: hypothetical protein LQ338_004230 [Usnochroma carphineum]